MVAVDDGGAHAGCMTRARKGKTSTSTVDFVFPTLLQPRVHYAELIQVELHRAIMCRSLASFKRDGTSRTGCPRTLIRSELCAAP